MDVVKFIKERNRMCNSFCDGCEGCPAFNAVDYCCAVGTDSMMDAKKQVAIVEKWSAEHPKKKKKTRQDVFLKQYTEAYLDKHGVLIVCPLYVSADYRDSNGLCGCQDKLCSDCRRDFWMAEVEEDK